VAAAALSALGLASADAASASTYALDLSNDAATTFTAGGPDRSLGSSVARAGDVNGDGTPDLVIGAPESSRNGRKRSGSAYVVFGTSPLMPRLPLDPLGAKGFRIDGAPPELKAKVHDIFGDGRGPLTDMAGGAVAGIGDVNGDGLDDVAVAAPDASPHRRIAAGAVYVVFGTRSTARVDLKHLDSGGYRIAGAEKGQDAGFATAAAGDVNGDGRGDILVGAFLPLAGYRGGRVYVVFGHPDRAPVDLAHLGANGIAIRGPWTAGPYLAALGDVNGDRLADVVVGAPPVSKGNVKGHAYVIFGRTAPGALRLGSLGSAGYSITDSGNTDFAGNLGGLVGGPGDVNGDGRPDVLVGGGDVTHVLFSDGSRKPVDLAHSAGRSIRITSLDLGGAASGTGDSNGDGLADIVLGEPYAAARCQDTAGSATIVYGRRKPARIRLSSLGRGGYRVDGAARYDAAGSAAAWAGDLDGDGKSDLLLGAPGAGLRGRAYLVTRRTSRAPQPPTSPCVQLAIRGRGLGTIARTGRLRVRIKSRWLGDFFLTARVKHHGAIAHGATTFRRAGTKTVDLTLTSRGRALLASRRRIRVHATTQGYPFNTPAAYTSAVLVR
jgi:hypothetical protein